MPEGSPSHSQAYLDAGKTETAHGAIVTGAKVLAATAADLISVPGLLDEIKKEFATRKAQLEAESRA